MLSCAHPTIATSRPLHRKSAPVIHKLLTRASASDWRRRCWSNLRRRQWQKPRSRQPKAAVTTRTNSLWRTVVRYRRSRTTQVTAMILFANRLKSHLRSRRRTVQTAAACLRPASRKKTTKGATELCSVVLGHCRDGCRASRTDIWRLPFEQRFSSLLERSYKTTSCSTGWSSSSPSRNIGQRISSSPDWHCDQLHLIWSCLLPNFTLILQALQITIG